MAFPQIRGVDTNGIVVRLRWETFQPSPSHLTAESSPLSHDTVTMISDRDLFTIAVFFGVTSMLLILTYHFLEANAIPNAAAANKANHAKTS
ncbi:hypothetical protein E4U55_006519 [Claviceps digitariae]|nr:hypothetical protein E4U55_006519 [Claviceps digitariae]